MSTEPIRLYFANLNEYNAGRLVGKWYDLEDYTDANDLMTDVTEQVLYGDSNVNEWAVHDYEAPFRLTTEWPDFSDIQAMIDFCNLDEDEQIKATYLYEGSYYSGLDECIRHTDDVEFYKNMTLEDVAEELVDSGCFGDIPKALEFYIDYEKIARDLSVDGYHEEGGNVFRVM